MFSTATKNLLIFIEILFIVEQVSSKIIPFEKLSLGDTVDKKNFEETSAVVYGNIINFNEEIPSIINSLTKSVKNLPTWSSAQFTCSKPLNSLFEDSVEDKSLFKNFDKRKLNYQLFKVDKKYLNNNHMCLLFELCKSEKQTYEKFVDFFQEKFFDKYYDDYYWYHDNRHEGKHIEILKFVKGNGTHFVSAIHNGDCLFQIFIFNTEPENSPEKIDYLKKTPEYTSKIVMASKNHILEESLTYHLNSSDNFLFNFPNFPLKEKSDILNYLSLDNIMSIELTALPKLPRSLEFKEDKIESPKERSNLMKLQPGDSFNINDLESDSVLKSRNMLNFKIFDPIKYSNPQRLQITNYSDIIMEKSSLSCPKFVTQFYGDVNEKNIETLNPFDCLLEEQSYGIDGKFFNENYTRSEIKICMVVEEQKTGIDPLEIVYLNENSIDLDYNIFENENVVLRFQKSNETHYVSSIQFGDCLYQALVYNSDEEKPVYKGKILSASKNNELEQTIEDYLNSDSKIDSLYDIYSNKKLKNKIIEKLNKETVVNIDLRSIYKKRSLPLSTLSEYNNLEKNSSQNLPIKTSEVSQELFSQNLPIKTSEVSQELLTAIFKNLSEPNEAFKTFTEDLFTAMFKNMSKDLFPGVLENLSTETREVLLSDASENSSEELLIDTFHNSLPSSGTETLKETNSSNLMQPSLLNIVLILTAVLCISNY